MKKIITLFQRTDRLVRDEIVPGAEWVVNGEGVATRKFNGTCVLFKEGRFFKRFDVKKGRKEPKDFIPAQDSDLATGHWPGWVPVKEFPDPEDQYFREAIAIGSSFLPTEDNSGFSIDKSFFDGTYELIGPKVHGDPEGAMCHMLIRHGITILVAPRTFEGIKKFLSENNYLEGIVWHHPDGRMVKIKARDFGLKNQVAKVTT